MSISMLTSVALGTPSPTRVKWRARWILAHTVDCTTGKGQSLRNLLFYCKQWASLFFILERVPQGYLGQKQGWEMAQVKSSQGLVFLETCNKTCSNTCRSKICRSGRRLFQPPSCPTEFTKIFLKTCSSVSSLGTPVTQSTNWQFSQASSYYLFLSELTTKLVSCGYCNKLTSTWWFQTTEIRFLLVGQSEALNPAGRKAALPLRALSEEAALPLRALGSSRQPWLVAPSLQPLCFHMVSSGLMRLSLKSASLVSYKDTCHWIGAQLNPGGSHLESWT